MKKRYYILFAALTVLALFGSSDYRANSLELPSVYTFTAKTIDGKDKALRDYYGKVLLIVNVASKCGYTPQYEGLEKLYEEYKNRGFEILAFPCNQFHNQEPGTPEEIKAFCSENYGVTFQLFEKIDVNGENAHELYKYLTNVNGETQPIEWNFTKFLIGKDGMIISRYSTKTEPEKIASDIEKALAK
jgi:glutathione peroxidase